MGWCPTFSTIVMTIKFADLQKIGSAGHLVYGLKVGSVVRFFKALDLAKAHV